MALLTTTLGRLLGARRGAVAVILGISGYAILVGGGAPVVRAAIMAGLALFARLFGRRQDGINTLAFTAAFMGTGNPQILWDTGFQLTFTATFGLVLYSGPLSQRTLSLMSHLLPGVVVERLARLVSEYLLFTLAAQLLTLLVIIYHFGRISWVSLLANPLILPAQPPLMILSGLSVLFGFLWEPVGQVVAFLAWPFVAFTIRSVE